MLKVTKGSILFFGVVISALFSCQMETSIPLDKQWNVVVFMDPECPVSQYYTRTLSELMKKDTTDQFGYVAIYPGHRNLSAAQTFQAGYNLNFTPVADPDYTITKKLDATVTPQAFLLNSEGKIFYNGAIDNSFVSLGKRRSNTSEFYLLQAMESVGKPDPVPLKKHAPVGCLIER